MPGVLLVSHGNLAQELLKTVEMIMGPQDGVEAVGLYPGEGMEFFRDRVSRAISKINDGRGVLIFADLFGGTPFNSCVSLVTDKGFKTPVDIVTGMNLPMVIEACTFKNIKNLTELGEAVKAVVTSGVKFFSDLLPDESRLA
ncbi:PTS sugar transporter subunit IIA [Thermoanaerobacterium sp. DL9XJH110]|uniref:PTS sugar transporter subunit IIA n=1 Tax=Thermoanaerobacterium sp. DL9XJH110 TaxID=3386643 RepID=UPI003BB65CFF